MDHYSTCILLLGVGVKYLYTNTKEEKRHVPEKRNQHLLQSFMPGFMSRRADWIAVCPSRLALIAVLVSLFCSVEMVHQDSNKVPGLTMKLKYDDFYKSVVFSLFILFSIRLQTPMLMGPWLNFTLRRFLMTELPSLAKYINDLPHQNIVSTIMLYTLTAYIVMMQVHWWAVICNYHNSLWVDMIQQLLGKPGHISLQGVSKEMDDDKSKKICGDMK